MSHQIQQFILTMIPHEHRWKITLLSHWTEIMGNLTAQVSLEKIEHDLLVLGVANSCLMQELHLLSPLLLNTINQTLDQPRIKRLRFKKITVKKKLSSMHQEQKTDSSTYIQTLTVSEQQALNKIVDVGLRDALHAFRIRCHQEK